MKSKTVLGCLAVLFLAVSPVVGLAQRSGLQVGITQSPFALAPMQNPVGGTRGSFNLVPTFVPPPTTIGPIVPLVPNFPTVIVPNQVLLPGQTFLLPEQGFFPGQTFIPGQAFFSGQPFLPPPVVNPGSSIFFPANPIQPGLPFVSTPIQPGPFVSGVGPVFPPVGMPRAEVLRQFGPPSVSVITSTAETMFFPGGATVTIQNGQVAGPR
jgi:hypothetical protein